MSDDLMWAARIRESAVHDDSSMHIPSWAVSMVENPGPDERVLNAIVGRSESDAKAIHRLLEILANRHNDIVDSIP